MGYVDPQEWLQQQYDASRKQYEANLRSSGLGPHQPGGFADQLSEQMDGSFDARAQQAARDAVRAQGEPDPVSGQRVSPWLRTMAGRMTPTENPAPAGPPQRNLALEQFSARRLAEQADREAAEQRSRSEGWQRHVNAQIVGDAERARAEAGELDLRIAERAEAQRAAEWAARRAERRAAADEQRRQLVDEIAAEVEAERVGREWEERQAARQRWSARARRAEAAALDEEEFGDDWSPWGGDAA